MLPSLRLALTGALAASASASTLPQLSARADNSSRACNNSPQLCGRQYNDVTYVGAHDSAFLRDSATDFSDSGNQFENATDALDAGLRMLQAQVKTVDGVLRLCHTSCDLLDAGPLQDWLGDIADWMAANTDEVVTLLLVNDDSSDVSDFAADFSGSGLAKFAFTPLASGPTTSWPTLETMIDEGQRLVSFITNIDPSSDSPYLLDEFDYVFETAFGVTDINGFNCSLDRPSDVGAASDAISSGFLGLINHFLDSDLGIGGITVPDVDAASQVNSDSTTAAGSLGLNLQTCKDQWGVVPNFVIVDFWNEGDVVKAGDAINDIDQVSGRSNPGAAEAEDSDGGAMSARSAQMGRGALLAFVAAVLMMV